PGCGRCALLVPSAEGPSPRCAVRKGSKPSRRDAPDIQWANWNSWLQHSEYGNTNTPTRAATQIRRWWQASRLPWRAASGRSAQKPPDETSGFTSGGTPDATRAPTPSPPSVRTELNLRTASWLRESGRRWFCTAPAKTARQARALPEKVFSTTPP